MSKEEKKRPTCKICFNNFNRTNEVPLILKCGHSICANCARAIEKEMSIECPFCRCKTGQTSKTAPKNFCVLELIDSAKAADQKKPEILLPPKKKEIKKSFSCVISRDPQEIDNLQHSSAISRDPQEIDNLQHSSAISRDPQEIDSLQHSSAISRDPQEIDNVQHSNNSRENRLPVNVIQIPIQIPNPPSN